MKIPIFSSSELPNLYIVEIQNLTLDSLFIPCKYIGEVPIYNSWQTKYFSSLNDTLLISFDLPSNTPPTNEVRVLQNEKKYFLTSIRLNENIANIEYAFYSYINNNKQLSKAKVILTKKKGDLIDLTKY